MLQGFSASQSLAPSSFETALMYVHGISNQLPQVRPQEAIAERKQEMARAFMSQQSPASLAPILQEANLSQRFTGQTPLNKGDLRQVVEQAEDQYQNKQSQGIAQPGHVELISALSQRFGRDQVAKVTQNFLHKLRQTSFRAVKYQDEHQLKDLPQAQKPRLQLNA